MGSEMCIRDSTAFVRTRKKRAPVWWALGIRMTERCENCGVEYTPLILERFEKGSRIGALFELFGYVVLGGYALACYYFSDSIIILFLCSVLALILYHFTYPKDENFCYECSQQKGKNK